MVKLCDFLGLTHFSQWIRVKGPSENFVEIKLSTVFIACIASFFFTLLALVPFVAKAPLYAALLGRVRYIVKIASVYFISIGAIGFIASFILVKKLPSN